MDESFRKDERVPVDLDCVIRPAGGKIPGRILDLGLGGLSAMLDRNIETTESVEVEFSLPLPGPTIRLPATVQWCRRHNGQWKVGLAFVDPPGSKLIEIAQWLARIPRTTEIE